jgi:uncharacterized DUF497 family protein
MLDFAWDPHKAIANWKKHGVTFGEAITVFSDPLSVTEADDGHPSEERFFTIGHSDRARMLVVVHTEDSETIRIIRATRNGARAERLRR